MDSTPPFTVSPMGRLLGRASRAGTAGRACGNMSDTYVGCAGPAPPFRKIYLFKVQSPLMEGCKLYGILEEEEEVDKEDACASNSFFSPSNYLKLSKIVLVDSTTSCSRNTLFPVLYLSKFVCFKAKNSPWIYEIVNFLFFFLVICVVSSQWYTLI